MQRWKLPQQDEESYGTDHEIGLLGVRKGGVWDFGVLDKIIGMNRAWIVVW